MGRKEAIEELEFLLSCSYMDIPISECHKAYDVAIDYLRSQGKIKG